MDHALDEPAVDRAHQVPVVVDQVQNGQGAGKTSTMVGVSRRKRGSKPARAIASWRIARFRRAQAACRAGSTLEDEVLPHSRASSWARSPDRRPESNPARISASRR